VPQAFTLSDRVSRAITRVLRRLGVHRSTTHDVVTRTRKMALDAGPMAVQDLSRQLAEEFADDLKRLIEQQAFAWVPLSSKYSRRKQMLRLDPRILIATGRYVRSIRPVQQPDGSWVVGIPPTPLFPGSRHTLQDLARWLEFGTRNMPARPHWRPAMSLWKTKSYQAKLALKHGVSTYLRRRGFR